MQSNFIYKTLDSGSKLIRFNSLHDIFEFDEFDKNPRGLGFVADANSDYDNWGDSNVRHSHNSSRIIKYKEERNILTPKKQQLILKAQKDLSVDKEFLELVYKAKSEKREFKLNKFRGNLSMPHYASNSDKIFKKSQPGAKKQTLNMAFQVGTFSGGNYEESFIRILKTILMCQAMNISVNIDVFDSDTKAINNGNGYVICNVASSSEKLNFKSILAASHEEFFHLTLFNGYSASGCQKRIGTFLPESLIKQDLAPMYDVIGGNLLLDRFEGEQKQLVSKILKIGINGNSR